MFRRIVAAVPVAALLVSTISGFALIYNQGVHIEHRLSVVETKLDLFRHGPQIGQVVSDALKRQNRADRDRYRAFFATCSNAEAHEGAK